MLFNAPVPLIQQKPNRSETLTAALAARLDKYHQMPLSLSKIVTLEFVGSCIISCNMEFQISTLYISQCLNGRKKTRLHASGLPYELPLFRG